MKYTEEQKKQLKDKMKPKFTKNAPFIPLLRITKKDGFYIIESKINK